MVFSGRPTRVETTQGGGGGGVAWTSRCRPNRRVRAARRRARRTHLWQWAPPLAVAEWRTLLAEFFASPPWSGQQAESFVSAKNRERKAVNLKRKQDDQLTLITLQTFKNRASKEKKGAAGQGREPGQFRPTLAPVAPDATRIKATEWGEIEAKVIELFDLTAMHLPTRKHAG
jgi:hypothetical protein